MTSLWVFFINIVLERQNALKRALPIQYQLGILPFREEKFIPILSLSCLTMFSRAIF